MRALIVIFVIIGSSTLPAGATAAYAPPGNAAIQQYFDPLPSSGGDVSAPGVSDARTGTDSGPNGSLPPGLRLRLARQGTAGAAVARLIAANSFASSRPTELRSRRGSATSASPAGMRAPLPLTAAPRSGLSQLADAALTGTEGGGVGIVLPLVLVAALGAVIVGVVRRRRTHS